MFILKCSRYSETTLNYYNELPCPVSRSTPKCNQIFLDISLEIHLYGFCLLWCSGYLQTLLGRHPKPNSFLCSGQIVRSSSHSSNNPTRAKHSLPSSSTPSRGGLKTTIQVLFCATCTILHNKNRSSALFSSIKVTFFLRIFLKRIEKTHLKSPVFTKCLLVWLYMESVGNVGVWCVPSNPLSALPKECRWKTKTV